MGNLGFTYRADDIPQDTTFEPIPAGWYTASITNAEVKPTRDNSGSYIKLRFDILGPSHQGRVVFANINIRNKSDQAEKIGVQQLGELMRAIGLPALDDTDQLVGGNCQINVKIRAATDQYDAQNEVKGFKSVSGSPLPTASGGSVQQQSNTPSASTPPWQR